MVQPDYEKLQALMKEKKISRKQLAINTGISVNSLTASFQRKSRMQNENYRRIIEYLDADLFEYVTDEFLPPEFMEDEDNEKHRLLSIASGFTEYAKGMTFEGIMITLKIMKLLSEVPYFQRPEVQTVADSFLQTPLSVLGDPDKIEKALSKGFAGEPYEEPDHRTDKT